MNKRTKDALRLRFLSKHIPVRIRGGVNKGLKFSLATRKAFILGTFEEARVRAIFELAKGRQVVWDVGGHMGYVTLALSRARKADGWLYVVEPERDNLSYLRRHVRWNRLERCEVLPYAIAEESGEVTFYPASHGTGRIVREAREGAYTVKSVSFDDLVRTHGVKLPEFIKVDIDHSACDFIAGAHEVLSQPNVVLTVATADDRAVHERIRRDLQALGLAVVEPRRCQGESWSGIESELLAHGPEARISAEALEAFLSS